MLNDLPTSEHERSSAWEAKPTGGALKLPTSDNDAGALDLLLAANAKSRREVWPEPFVRTTHELRLGDARDLSEIRDNSIDLIVTSPPYWTLKKYDASSKQLGAIANYANFLKQMDKVWLGLARILKPGGRICCVVGDVCISRKSGGRHRVIPLHADLQVRVQKAGLDCLTPILWHKITNAATEVAGNGAGFYGKPYQPGSIIKNDIEYILFFRKGGSYRSVGMMEKALSMIDKTEMQQWFRSVWSDIKGASTRSGHPAPYPVELAERLVKMFSFAGDTVLDPFSGTASTSVATIRCGRNSIGIESEVAYHRLAAARIEQEIARPRSAGATQASLLLA